MTGLQVSTWATERLPISHRRKRPKNSARRRRRAPLLDLDGATESTVARTADSYRFGKIFVGPKLTICSAENRNRMLDPLKKTHAL